MQWFLKQANPFLPCRNEDNRLIRPINRLQSVSAAKVLRRKVKQGMALANDEEMVKLNRYIKWPGQMY